LRHIRLAAAFSHRCCSFGLRNGTNRLQGSVKRSPVDPQAAILPPLPFWWLTPRSSPLALAAGFFGDNHARFHVGVSSRFA
jgi:hypothetical protein